jgi:tetratricopeptide (TPR) repeat protein
MHRTPPPTPLRPLALAGALLLALAPAGRAQVCEDTRVFLAADTRTNYSLGYEHYKNEDYCAALPYLRWIVRTAPLFTSQGAPDDRNFRRLMDSYEGIAAIATDPALRRTYLDSVQVVRAQMQQTLAANNVPVDAYAAALSEGRFYAEHAAEYPEQQDRAFELFLEGFRMFPDSTGDYYLNEIGRMAAVRAGAGQMTPAEGRDLVLDLVAYADDPAYLESLGDTFLVDPWDQWEGAYDEYLAGDRSEGVVTVVFAGTTQVDSLIAERRPEVDIPALRRELYPLLLEFRPTPNLLVLVGNMAIEEGREEEGFDYFARAVEMSETDTQLRDTHYGIASMLYRGGLFDQAYAHAGDALEIDSTFGGALYIRALITASTLGTGSLAERAGAWCVADLFLQAAVTAEGEQAERARYYAEQYLDYAPSPEEYGDEWEPGEQITARTGYGECTTTVR